VYEKQLKTLENNFIELEEKIELLLPAATSVGLAKSFNTSKC